MARTDLLKLFACIAITEILGGGLGSVFTLASLHTWYASLAKPSFAPPGYVIGAVWTALFLLMGSALYLIWVSKRTVGDKRMAITLYGVQLLFNVLWPFLFFYIRSPLYGFIEIILLWIAIAATIASFRGISRGAVALMFPYLLWVSFAAYLNLSVLLLNP